MNRFVIRGGCVLSLDPSVGVIEAGDVLVSDGRIETIGPDLTIDADTVDATGCIVMPGFIDTHRHTWQTTLRGLLPSCTLGEYFSEVMLGAGSRVSADDMYAGTLLGAYELLNAGITTVVDWANAVNTPEHADAGIAALREAGIRAMYGYGWPGGGAYRANKSAMHPVDARRVASEHFASADQLLTLGLALRGPATSSTEALRHDWHLARELNARITVHTGMRIPGAAGGEISVLDGLGLLWDTTTYVHCNNVTDKELDRIAETGGSVSVSAYCESLMGHGWPPTLRLLQHGLRPSLSADVVVSVPGDMFSHMRATYSDARIRVFPEDPAVPFAPTVTARDVLEFAVVDGAKAMGLDSRIGTLAPGKDADIIMVRADMVNTLPSVDPVATIVNHADVSNVEAVFVKGRAVKRDGKLLNVDLPRLRDLAVASRERLVPTAA